MKCGLHTHTHTHTQHTLSLGGTHKGLILSKLQLFCLFVFCYFFVLTQVRDSYRIFCLGAGNDTCANETLMSMYGASCLTLLFLTYIARSSISSTSESIFFFWLKTIFEVSVRLWAPKVYIKGWIMNSGWNYFSEIAWLVVELQPETLKNPTKYVHDESWNRRNRIHNLTAYFCGCFHTWL